MKNIDKFLDMQYHVYITHKQNLIFFYKLNL